MLSISPKWFQYVVFLSRFNVIYQFGKLKHFVCRKKNCEFKGVAALKRLRTTALHPSFVYICIKKFEHLQAVFKTLN